MTDFCSLDTCLVIAQKSVVFTVDGINDKIISSLNDNHEQLVPSHYLPLSSDSPDKKKVAEDIWQYYMKGEPLTWDNVNNYFRVSV